MSSPSSRWSCLALVVVASCADPDPAQDDGELESRWPLPRTCVPPPELARPATIDGVVELVNALPKPTTLPCFLESLERPLSIYASTSTGGAQPASGPGSPRIFVFRGDLVMSIVPEGTGSHTLELSQAIGNRMSIKAELEFPVEQTLARSAPYDQVDLGGGSTCGTCHDSETQVDSIDFATAWASDAYQDEPELGLSLAFLRQNALDCDPEAEPQRCGMLDAVFGHGDVEPGDLDRDSIICRAFQ